MRKEIKAMGKTLYLECYSGISGDMTVAALLDLGADQAVLDRVLKSLPVSGFETKVSRVVKSGIDACDFDVVLDKEHENHDHDMEYLHGHGHEHTHEDEKSHVHAHATEELHAHTHNHDTKSAHGHHHHEHRGMKEITHIIEHGDMTENAKKIALKIFGILAEAESKAHNVPTDQVHFHEVGAVDSIVDINCSGSLRRAWNCPLSAWNPADSGSGGCECGECKSSAPENDRGGGRTCDTNWCGYRGSSENGT